MMLAERLRPETIDEVVGQKHILGKGKLINKLLEKDILTNVVFYGPPGTGKTTLVKILTKMTNKKVHFLNATYSKTQDVRKIEEDLYTLESYNGVVVVIDEIHNFTKKQQQLLLEHVEKGRITLLAMTTENPFHHVYKSLLSRCTVIELFSLTKEDIAEGVKQGIKKINSLGYYVSVTDEIVNTLVISGGGDLRKSLNILGLCVELYSKDKKLDLTNEIIENVAGKKAMLYDRNGDEHYDTLSAFQKSIRGSDVDASLHYLARLIKSEDLISINRRLLVIACEDIGLAYPNAINIVKSCVDASLMLGLPEARIPLAQAVILLATAPKSNSSINAIDKAISSLEFSVDLEIPKDLKDAHYQGASKLNRGLGYKYPHNYKNHYVKQQYLPKALDGIIYYEYGENKFEQAAKDYMDKIKNI